MTEDKKIKLYARLKSPAFWCAIVGAGKLVTDSFGIILITDAQVNNIANGLSAIATIVGTIVGYTENV